MKFFLRVLGCIFYKLECNKSFAKQLAFNVGYTMSGAFMNAAQIYRQARLLNKFMKNR